MITLENKTIRLCWDKDDLFRTVCTETAYNVRTLTDDKGQPLFDRYAMTDDERLFFDEHIAQAVNGLLHHFRRIVPDTQPAEVEDTHCGFTFSARLSAEGEKLYSQVELDAVEHTAKRLLCYTLLAEWYLSVQAGELWKTYLQKLATVAAELSALLFRFYRPALRRSYSTEIDPNGYPTKNYEFDIDAGTI